MLRRLLLLPLFLLLPLPALATDISECDSGTIECSCPSAIAASDAAVQSLDDATSCNTYCGAASLSTAYAAGSITGYSLSCSVSGVSTIIAQGSTTSSTTSTSSTKSIDNPYTAPELGVEIPGLTLTPTSGSNGFIQVNYLGEYVNAVYTWLISAVALVAVVMIMIGGLQYVLARGDSGKIGDATKRIQNSLIGIVLLLGAYTIARTIDPNQTVFDPLSINYVDFSSYDLPQPDLPGDVSLTDSTVYAAAQGIVPGDILCEGASVADIAQSAVGKVTYRYGAKGTRPVYSAETKVDSDGIPFSSYCPTGTVCYDCSGFANYIGQCAGLASAGESGGTSEIFSTSEGAEVISSIDGDNGIINGVALVPGDMVGAPSDHVMTYIGGGQIADSHAGDRAPGDAIGIYPLSYLGTKIMTGRDALYVRRR